MRLSDAAGLADNFNMMKTIVIAVCSAVAYLAIVIGLTVYCSIRLMRAKNQRKQRHSEITANGTGRVPPFERHPIYRQEIILWAIAFVIV